MERVLFLDLDGPVWPDRVTKFHPDNTMDNHNFQLIISEMEKNGDTFAACMMTYWRMDEVAVGMLNRLMDIQPFYTVVSSTWREFCSKDTIQMLFDENDLNLQLHQHWMTPLAATFRGDFVNKDMLRLLEIKRWLANHSDTVSHYAVLDDPSSGGVLVDDSHVRGVGLDPNAVVLVDPFIGMEIFHFDQLRKLLTI